MKVIVMGGGVIGVATAYYLARNGHEVVVIERAADVALETSFANAGIIAPGHAHAWASPQAPLTLLKSLWRDDTALRLRLRFDPRMWLWSLYFLRNCTTARNRANTLVKFRLCDYSREALKALRAETGASYDESTRGALYLYRDPRHFETGLATLAHLRDHGLELEAIDAARCVEIEPALAPMRDRLAGAIYCPSDESGDSHLLCRALRRDCEERGAEFRFGTTVQGLRTEGDRIAAVVTDRGDISGDAYVLSLASESPFVVGPLGVRLPIYPVKGYSVTFPVENHDGAPRMPLVDEHHLVAFSRLGDRLRATATADFAGYDTSFTAADFAPMMRVVRAMFPDGADYDRPSHWACLRPMTPDGPPVIGRGRHRNLYYNTGHGHIGWTMAAGSGRITADLVAGRVPEIDLAGMEPERF
ncbi:MAG: D-amino acid dehydrogenase [Alphaproteobacteria bacterium]